MISTITGIIRLIVFSISCFYFHFNCSTLLLLLLVLQLFPNPFQSMALSHSHVRFFFIIYIRHQIGHHISHRYSIRLVRFSIATHFAHHSSICLFVWLVWFWFWQFLCQVQDRVWIFILSPNLDFFSFFFTISFYNFCTKRN